MTNSFAPTLRLLLGISAICLGAGLVMLWREASLLAVGEIMGEQEILDEPDERNESNDHNEPAPASSWIVFMEETVVRDAPSSEATILGRLNGGDELDGEYHVDPETDEEWLILESHEGDGASSEARHDAKRYVTRTAIHRVHSANIVEGDLDYGAEVVNRWWGLPLEYEPSDLVEIPSEWTGGGGRSRLNPERRRSHRLRADVADALARMFEAARGDGVELRVISAYRSGERQKRIYTRNVQKNRAQRSSAPAGHSEHQLGTTVDISDAESKHNFSRTFDELPEGKWLTKNAERFGFHRSYYPENVVDTGYISEPWHWRYKGEDN